jgi:hypothetical protein
MLVFAIECLQAIYMLLAGYFRLTKDLPKPVWRYQVSYIFSNLCNSGDST